ncbi:MAG: hypothetical protein Q9166_000573 [cf. Caloplaca sp. 2 TL-2023]
MSVAIQAYYSPRIGTTSETFNTGSMEAKGRDNLGVRDFVPSSARRWLDAQQQQGRNQQIEDNQSFFDFEPQTESASQFVSQYPSLPDMDLTPGWNSIAGQVPSPPQSASSPPASWPPFQYQGPPTVHNILTDIYPDTRVQYGQNTPPDDEFSNLFAAVDQQPSDAKHESEGKRERQSTPSDSKNNTPAKRSRKNGRASNGSTGQASSSAEEVRRSKFLERNRVAASKCRQKKKEWTQNLEKRARDLQKENQSMRMMMESMRDEMLFIKGEMLKHTTCGCEQIQGWVKSNANSLCTSPAIKTEHSPINSAPASRCGSVSIAGADFNAQESLSSGPEASGRSKSPQTQSLESLLINQLVHDTSDQGIEKTLQATE